MRRLVIPHKSVNEALRKTHVGGKHFGIVTPIHACEVQYYVTLTNKLVKTFSAKVPLKRLAKIEEVVDVTVFLASDKAGYMTGQAINITGGREMH